MIKAFVDSILFTNANFEHIKRKSGSADGKPIITQNIVHLFHLFLLKWQFKNLSFCCIGVSDRRQDSILALKWQYGHKQNRDSTTIAQLVPHNVPCLSLFWSVKAGTEQGFAEWPESTWNHVCTEHCLSRVRSLLYRGPTFSQTPLHTTKIREPHTYYGINSSLLNFHFSTPTNLWKRCGSCQKQNGLIDVRFHNPPVSQPCQEVTITM